MRLVHVELLAGSGIAKLAGGAGGGQEFNAELEEVIDRMDGVYFEFICQLKVCRYCEASLLTVPVRVILPT